MICSYQHIIRAGEKQGIVFSLTTRYVAPRGKNCKLAHWTLFARDCYTIAVLTGTFMQSRNLSKQGYIGGIILYMSYFPSDQNIIHNKKEGGLQR